MPRHRTAECPNFFKLGSEWVLFVSPYGKVQYFVGTFDPATCCFRPRARGLLDHGPNFYAPNTLLVPGGRRLVWGWVTGFPGGRGWNGCLSLSRELGFSRDGQLQQRPAPELSKLRGEGVVWRNLDIADEPTALTLSPTNTLEIAAEIDVQSAASIHLQLKGDDVSSPVDLTYNGLELRVIGKNAPPHLAKGERKWNLRILVDRSVLEVFANGTVCVTKRIDTLPTHPRLHLRCRGRQSRGKANRSVADEHDLVKAAAREATGPAGAAALRPRSPTGICSGTLAVAPQLSSFEPRGTKLSP